MTKSLVIEFNEQDENRLLTLFRELKVKIKTLDDTFIERSWVQNELTNKYDPDKILKIQKLDPEVILNIIYFDGDSKHHFVKRFNIENRQEGKEFEFITENQNSKLVFCSLSPNAKAKINVLKGREKEKVEIIIDFNQFMEIKGWKAQGNRLTQFIFTGEIEDITKYENDQEHIEEIHEQNEYMYDIGSSIDLPIESKINGEQGKLFE